MPSSVSSNVATHTSLDLLPYRCPACVNQKRFRSLIALRLHASIVHDIHDLQQPNKKPPSTPATLSPSNIESRTALADNSSSTNDATESTAARNEDDVVDFSNLLSGTSVDDMFNKYSAKIDEVTYKFDSRSRSLESRLKLTQQLEEIRRQKEQLGRIKQAWHAAHGVSRLVHETDVVINKNLSYEPITKPANDRSANTYGSSTAKPSAVKKASKSQTHDPSYTSNVAKQLDISVHLAAQYKELAMDAEKKLKDKIEEERHLKEFIEATAVKEQEAKRKLAEFMESLLQRAEYAESKLKDYQSGMVHESGPSRTAGHSHPRHSTPIHKNKENRKETRFKDPMTSAIGGRSRFDGSGISFQGDNSANTKRLHEDPYVDEILERPSSAETSRGAVRGRRKQLGDLNTSELVDTFNLTPFSNCDDTSQNTTRAADRRVALFCVFTHLRSIDLLHCALVCREWRDTSRHRQLWSRIRFHDVKVDPQLFCLVSDWSRETCYFCLKNISLLSDATSPTAGALEEGVERILKSSAEKLLVLSIDQCDPFITSRVLWLVSCYNKNICSVSYRSSLDPVSHQVAWALGSSCRNIVSLEVAPLQPCSVRGLFTNNVARLLSWCWPQLQALSFGGLDIDGAGLLAVALNCHHLKVLELEHARGVSQEQAMTVCKHGLKELHTLLFTHTPVLPSTLLHFLKHLNLKSVYVIVSQKDYFTRKKLKKMNGDYVKISRALQNLSQHHEYRHILAVECK